MRNKKIGITSIAFKLIGRPTQPPQKPNINKTVIETLQVGDAGLFELNFLVKHMVALLSYKEKISLPRNLNAR